MTYFNCQEVNISIAAVNREGTSMYSQLLRLRVYGGIILIHFDPFKIEIHFDPFKTETQFAEHPNATSFTVDIKEDTRKRFFGHGIVNISWDQPSGKSYNTH